MNFSALAFAFFTSSSVPDGYHHSYFLWQVLPLKFKTYSSLAELISVEPSFSSFTMLCSVNQLFTDFAKSWKSEYCSVEFQSKVGRMRVVEGLGASALR